MRKITLAFSGLFLYTGMLTFTGCDKKVGMIPVTDPSKVACDSVKYSRDIEPIINTSCAKAGCHDAITRANNVELTSYSLVKTQVDLGRIKARVIDGNPSYMPADVGKLPDDKLKKIQCWLDKGAPNN